MVIPKPPHFIKASNLLYVVNLNHHAVKYNYNDEIEISLTGPNYKHDDLDTIKLLTISSYQLLLVERVSCIYSTLFFYNKNNNEDSKRFRY